MKNPNEIVKKAQDLQVEFSQKGQDITFVNAVQRVTGKARMSYSQVLAEKVAELIFKSEQEGRRLNYSQAVREALALDTLDKIEAAIYDLDKLEGEDFKKQAKDIEKALEDYRNNKVDKVQEIKLLLWELQKLTRVNNFSAYSSNQDKEAVLEEGRKRIKKAMAALRNGQLEKIGDILSDQIKVY